MAIENRDVMFQKGAYLEKVLRRKINKISHDGVDQLQRLAHKHVRKQKRPETDFGWEIKNKALCIFIQICRNRKKGCKRGLMKHTRQGIHIVIKKRRKKPSQTKQ